MIGARASVAASLIGAVLFVAIGEWWTAAWAVTAAWWAHEAGRLARSQRAPW